ncbi:MAG: hypothetical protein AB8F78_16780 [Saprospiraceae bacterium]
MNRILILGGCGAGKSTLARRLHEKTNLPVFHLDQHYHLPNWQEPTREDWRATVQELVKGDQWIIDGNYGSSMDITLAAADTIIYLDLPTTRCFWRVIKRTWKHHGTVRPDMPEGCKERFTFEFLHYVALFGVIKRPGLLKKFEAFAGEKIMLRTDKEAQAFLAES